MNVLYCYDQMIATLLVFYIRDFNPSFQTWETVDVSEKYLRLLLSAEFLKQWNVHAKCDKGNIF